MASILAQFPMPEKPPLPRLTDPDMAISLLEGVIADMRTQAQFLVKCLANHREIDVDLWRDLADVAGDLFGGTDRLLCVRCLAQQRIKLGRGRGFDEVVCDDCRHEEQAL